MSPQSPAAPAAADEVSLVPESQRLPGGAVLLAQILQTVSQAQPFTRVNQKRVYGIAALVALGTYGASIAQFLVTNVILVKLVDSYRGFGPVNFVGDGPGWLPAIAVLVTIALSGVIQLGRQPGPEPAGSTET